MPIGVVTAPARPAAPQGVGSSVTEGSHIQDAARRVPQMVMVWSLIAVVTLGGVSEALAINGVGPIPGRPIALHWWHLALLYLGAEMTVVHFHFRSNTHSFSLSEIPLVLGLFFADPMALIAGQLLGNAIALALGRRQSPIKLVFNLAQFSLTTGLAIMVFRTIWMAGEAPGAVAWVAAGVAALSSLALANALIHIVIRMTGGHQPIEQVVEVFSLSAVGSLVNAMFGINAVALLWFVPGAAWLSVAPPMILYLAYQAYTAQRLERSRLEAVYDASRRLHASPSVDDSVVAAAELAMQILQAECVELALSSDDQPGTVVLYTMVESGESELAVANASAVAPWRNELAAGHRPRYVASPVLPVAGREASEAMVVPLKVEGSLVGVFVVANHVGDVGSFTSGDLNLLVTLADQLSVSLENGRLGDSLAMMTDLKEQLEHEVKARDEFVASVSHELRTPLTAIMGLASQLWTEQESFSEDEVSEFLGLIAGQSKDLGHIIEDLLVSARADTGSLVVKPDQLKLDAELRSVCAESDVVDVDLSLIEPDMPGWADPIRVRQIIRNLLTNAGRYGGSQVVAEIDTIGGLSVLSIRDDGPGVPTHQIEAIFEPYERAHHSEGTTASVGLGLAVSRTLARLQGGDLVYRRRGEWTVFELSLPAEEPSATITVVQPERM